MTEYSNGEGYADPTAFRAIRKVQGDEMTGGTVIKYTNGRGSEEFFVVLGSDREIITGITLYASQRNDAVSVWGMSALPSRVRFTYLTNIPDYEVAGYASDAELAELHIALAAYFGLGTPEAVIYTPEGEKPVKTASAASEAVISTRIVELETEARIYRELYNGLLSKVAGATA